MTRWVISDPHFGHANILTFFDYDGTRVRDFSSVEEMDETMVNNFNKVVHQNDVTYFIGDIVINKKFLPIVKRLNGSKRLIKGNHDIFDDQMYHDVGFKNIHAMRIFPKQAILTHIPIHPNCIERFKVNLHGHIHGMSIHDKRFRNCCVDFKGDEFYPTNNYTPLNLDIILDNLK